MRLAAAILALFAAGLGSFSWWGICTSAGRAKFDEMDGIYPFAAGALAALLAAVAIALLIIARAVRPTP